MKNSNIIKEIFENPALIEKLSMKQIDAWISEAPYVQYLYLLKALKLKSQGITESKAYHKAATVVTDRIKMNELIDKLDQKNEEEIVKSKKKTKKKKKSNKKTLKIKKKTDSTSKSPSSDLTVSKALPVQMQSEDVIEESMHDWEEYITTFTSDTFTKTIDKSREEEVKSTLKKNSELSEFSEWLLALDRKNDEIDKTQVDQSVSIEGAAMSETLAKLMESQGHNLKAIEMYEKLGLIYPEKSAYFASLIEKLKKQ